MDKVNKPPKKDNFGAWVFIVIVVIAMLLALGLFYSSRTIGNIQATMTAVERGTTSP